MIGESSVCANFASLATVTVGFIGFWSSDAGWDYMHTYEGAFEKAGVAVATEMGFKMAVRPGASTYAQGCAPNA